MKKHIRIIILLLLCIFAISCANNKPQINDTSVEIEVNEPTVEVEVAEPTVEVEVTEPTVEVETLKPTEEVKEAEPSLEVNDKESAAETDEKAISIDENGTYTSKEDVALYINTYGKLPSNYFCLRKKDGSIMNVI